MKKMILLAIFGVFFNSFLCANELTYQGIISPDMRNLCAKARKKFEPLPESIASPNKDTLFNSIEFNKGEKEILTALDSRHPDEIIIDGMTPLMAASYTGNSNAVNIFISKGANVNFIKPPAITTTPLATAILNQKFPIACQLILHGAKLPDDEADRYSLIRNTLITTVVDEIDGAVLLNFFMRNGFDPNEMGSKLETPLMRAIAVKSPHAVKVLLKHGARLDVVKQNGKTAWTVAQEKGHPKILKLLKEAQRKATLRKYEPAAPTPATV